MCVLLQEARKKLGAFMESAEVAVSEAAERRLGAPACSALLRNYILSCLPTSTSGGSKSSSDGSATSADLRSAAKAMADAAPDSEAAALLHAVCAGLLGSFADGVSVIKSWVDSHSSADATTALLLGAHLACSGSAPDLSLGLELLRHDRLPGTVRHACAVVATRAAMHEKISGDAAADQLQEEAQAAAQFWQGQPASEEQSGHLAACMEHQVVLALRQGTSESALKSLQDLQVPSLSSCTLLHLTLRTCCGAMAVVPVDTSWELRYLPLGAC